MYPAKDEIAPHLKKNLWLWKLTALLAGASTLWLFLSKRSLTVEAIGTIAAYEMLMLGLCALYTLKRPDLRLALLSHTAALFFAYSVCMGLVSYAVCTLDFPLVDSPLAWADRLLGFDWRALYLFVFGLPFLKGLLIVAYNSIIPQIGLLLVLLISLRHEARLNELIRLYAATSLSFILLSGLFPAEGAYGTYHVAEATPYLQQFRALREGGLPLLDLFKMQGIVQFPSFHLALALLCAYGARQIRFLFPALVSWNALVILATPPVGGHFFVDLLAGALLTAFWIEMDRRFWAEPEGEETP